MMKRKYRILAMEQISPGIWEVTYFVWIGCPGNRKQKTATIYKDRRPLLGELMEVDAKVPI